MVLARRSADRVERFAHFDWTGLPLDRAPSTANVRSARTAGADPTVDVTVSDRHLADRLDEQQYLALVETTGTPADNDADDRLNGPSTNRSGVSWIAH